MCTVTFIPGRESVVLTSSRDEQRRRLAALPPQVYEGTGGRLLYPKDPQAGGTWMAVHESGAAVVFLNGAWQKHLPQPPYRRSRGLVLLELLNSATPVQQFSQVDLNGIEPFTAVIWQPVQLWECRWDGHQKYRQLLDHHQPQIWSSVTLYSDAVIRRRQQWFADWLQEHPEPTLTSMRRFHRFAGDGDECHTIFMNRDNGAMGTVSITSLHWQPGAAHMQYWEVASENTYEQALALKPFIPHLL